MGRLNLFLIDILIDIAVVNDDITHVLFFFQLQLEALGSLL